MERFGCFRSDDALELATRLLGEYETGAQIDPRVQAPPRKVERSIHACVSSSINSQGDVLIASSQSLDRLPLGNFRGKEALDSPKLQAASATSSNMTGQRLSLRADPVSD